MVRSKIRGSHLTCKVANRCLNVRERLEVVGWKKDGPLPSFAVLWIASVCERKPWQKVITGYVNWFCNKKGHSCEYYKEVGLVLSLGLLWEVFLALCCVCYQSLLVASSLPSTQFSYWQIVKETVKTFW